MEKPLIDGELTINLTLNDLPVYLASSNTEISIYPKTKLLCSLLVHGLPNWLLKLKRDTKVSLNMNLFQAH